MLERDGTTGLTGLEILSTRLGKLVKKKISFLTDAAAQLDRVTTFAAAMLLCCAAAEQNAGELALEIDGLTQEGREFGDWKVVAMKTANRGSMGHTGSA